MQTTVTRIAHLSDVHMLDPRPSRARAGFSMRVRFLSLGRPLDAIERRRKLMRALDAARSARADHVVVSGDLTEIGEPEEFEAFAEVLHDSKIDPERITLVPGNHDAYTSMGAWKAALEGPLAAFAAGAAEAPGKMVERGGVCFMPLDVTRMQPVTRSAGELTDAAAVAVERRLSDPFFRDRPVVLVQHHPPFSHNTGAYQWLDGLSGGARGAA
jgi:3',5'-cyclic-AMP phosphodiesterase